MISNFSKYNHEIILDPEITVELDYDYATYLVIFNEEPTETILNVMVDLASQYHIISTEQDIYKQLQHLDFSLVNRKNWKIT